MQTTSTPWPWKFGRGELGRMKYLQNKISLSGHEYDLDMQKVIVSNPCTVVDRWFAKWSIHLCLCSMWTVSCSMPDSEANLLPCPHTVCLNCCRAILMIRGAEILMRTIRTSVLHAWGCYTVVSLAPCHLLLAESCQMGIPCSKRCVTQFYEGSREHTLAAMRDFQLYPVTHLVME